MRRFYHAIFFTRRFYIGTTLLAVFFIVSQFVPSIFILTKGAFLAFCLLIIADALLLFRGGELEAERMAPKRFSNGDKNQIQLLITNSFNNIFFLEVIDELPDQFQIREQSFRFEMNKKRTHKIAYNLTPKQRGEYSFGKVIILVKSKIGLVLRKIKSGNSETIKTYPSFINLEKYELIAASNRLKDHGPKRVRKIGQSMEFDHIKEYVLGDDTRKINWNASARKRQLMVNHYIDERSQSVYMIIDKGRTMKMPFEGLSLLDYSINSSLVISNVAIKKQDKVGLITFEDDVQDFVPPSKKEHQLSILMEALYAQKTSFKETDFSNLFLTINRKIVQRSLLLLFTNFESNYSLQRQIPFLKRIAKRHLLLIIYFENTEIKKISKEHTSSLEGIYTKVVAESFEFEKRKMAQYLNQHGIYTLLTTPQNLSIDLINKYLEIKRMTLI